jgi:hypothetical protein
MSVLQQHKVRRLREFRAGLLDIKSSDLSYQTMEKFLVENRDAVDAVFSYNPIIKMLSPHQKTTDLSVLEAVRQETVKIVDDQIKLTDANEVVRPILDDLILKIHNVKLAALRNEFNAAKETQPNMAAIGLGTVLCLVIQERAKMLFPLGPLAKREDLALQPMLDEAIKQRIFSDGLTKSLDAFRRHGLKEKIDNVAHKPGSNMLVSKNDLSAAVDLLNYLLPEIR